MERKDHTLAHRTSCRTDPAPGSSMRKSASKFTALAAALLFILVPWVAIGQQPQGGSTERTVEDNGKTGTVTETETYRDAAGDKTGSKTTTTERRSEGATKETVVEKDANDKVTKETITHTKDGTYNETVYNNKDRSAAEVAKGRKDAKGQKMEEERAYFDSKGRVTGRKDTEYYPNGKEKVVTL